MPYEVNIEIQDDTGKRGAFTVYTGDSQPIADQQDAIVALASAIDPNIDGIITRASLYAKSDLSSITGNTAVADGDVEEVGGLQAFSEAGFQSVIRIPAINVAGINTLEQAGTNELDTTDPSLAVLITALEDGLTMTSGFLAAPVDAGDSDITEIRRAQYFTRSSRED